jgi:hypothetical protein
MAQSTRINVQIEITRDAYQLARAEAARTQASVSQVVERALVAELGRSRRAGSGAGLATEAGVESRDATASNLAVAVTAIRALAQLAGLRLDDPPSDTPTPLDTGCVVAERDSDKPGREPGADAPLYYSLDDLPPKTSERAFQRALKAGLPVTRVGYAEVITPSAWVAWIERNARPRARATRAALPAGPTDDELLATVATRRTKR